jgi:hypothetical protein
MEHFLLACDYKTSKIEVKIEENQKGIHLPPWLDDPPKEEEQNLFVSAINSVCLFALGLL